MSPTASKPHRFIIILFSLCALCGIVLTASLVYLNTLDNAFVFDDHEYILNNVAIRQAHDPGVIWHSMPRPSRFIGLYTFALNYRLHGYDVFGYHLINLFIHIITGLFVFALARQLLLFASSGTPPLPAAASQKASTKTVTGSTAPCGLIALAAALIFVTHPLQTQAVTYVTQRFASLATMFYVGSFTLYLAGRTHRQKAIRLAALTGAVIMGVFGMFTKEITLTLPLMIVIGEYMFLPLHRQEGKRPPGRRIVLTAALAMTVIIPALYSFNVTGLLSMTAASDSHAGDILTPWTYFLTQLRVIVTYLRLWIVPLGQRVDYDFPASTSVFDADVICASILLAALMGATIILYRRERPAAFGLIWFFLTLSVESSFIVIRHVIFEHRLYLPSVGLSLLTAYGLYRLIQHKKVYAAATAVLICALGVLTVQRNEIWQDGVSLWSDNVLKTPAKAAPHIRLGEALIERGSVTEAFNVLNRGLTLDPQSGEAWNNRGLAYYLSGDYPRALADLNRAVELRPKYAVAYNNRGQVLQAQGRMEEAFKDFNQSITLYPTYTPPYVNRGIWLAQHNRYSQSTLR